MSMRNYGVSGYGFQSVDLVDNKENYDRIRAFMEKHLDDKDVKFFEDCESISDIEETCQEWDNGSGDVSQILAIAIRDATNQNVHYCCDDYGPGWVMLLPSYPWNNEKPISMEEFERIAGELANEFYGRGVCFDYNTTEDWG